jgi:ABC-type branched-subunit amino acid transport system ATPase component
VLAAEDIYCSYGPIGALLGDHGYVLSEGRLPHDGPVEELFGDERFRRAYLGG